MSTIQTVIAIQTVLLGRPVPHLALGERLLHLGAPHAGLLDLGPGAAGGQELLLRPAGNGCVDV